MATPASFAELLRSAVTEPGIISTAYRQFHNFSISNQLLAFVQCARRGIQRGWGEGIPWKAAIAPERTRRKSASALLAGNFLCRFRYNENKVL